MDAKEFARGYPYTLAPEVIHPPNQTPLLTNALDWSYRFGRLLHARLSDAPPDTLTTQREFGQYISWSKDFPDLEDELLSNPETGLRDRMEVNFHAMNRHMLDLWTPISRGRWPSEEKRLQRLTIAQNALALQGLFFYMVRQRHADQEGGEHIIFQPEYEEVNRYLSGMVQEYDAAIILLEFARSHPNLTIVPAPLQFERTRRRRNVDFVVVDVVDRQAVGVQVKTRARREAVERADQQRVIFVDGTTDLGNVKVMRIDTTSSRERVRPWPGIISAKRVESVPSHGRSLTRAGVHPSSIQYLKDEAHKLVGTIRVDYADLATKIGQRILAKL